MDHCGRCRVHIPGERFVCRFCLFAMCVECAERQRVTVRPSAPLATTNLLIDGVEMTVWTGDEAYSTASRQFVWWEPPRGVCALGLLCWCDATEREQREAARELPLHKLTGAKAGRDVPVLRSPEAQQSSTERQCFTLHFKFSSFSAQCDSAEQRTQWMIAFKQVLTLFAEREAGD